MDFLAQLFDLVLHLDQHLSMLVQQYGTWVYGVLFAVIFCETGLVVTPFLPGDSLLFVAGAVAARGGIDLGVLGTVLWAAAVAGDNTNYWIGHAVGPRAFGWEHSRIFNRAALLKTQAFYAAHGGKTVIIARFVPLVRTFAPFVAGVARMKYGRFVAFDVGGGALWIGSLTLAGYSFGNLPVIRNNLTLMIFAIIAVSLVPPVMGWLRHRRNRA